MHSFPEARNVKIETFLFLHQILHTWRVDSPVMMLIQIRAMVSRGMLPPDFLFIKMVQSGQVLRVPKYVIILLKIKQF